MDKKLLIIKPPYRTFPVGFAYVLSCLESNNIPFDFIDTAIKYPYYERILKKNDYFAVASGGLIGHFDFFCEIVRNVRNIRPDLPIILGNNITKDINPNFLFDKMGINYGIIGEAETSLPYLIDTIVKGSNDLETIPGLLFKDKFSGKVIKNAPRRLDLENVNILPAWHHFDIDYYSKDGYLPFFGRQSAMPVLSGRGCVGRCSFCSPTIGSYRMRPLKHVIQEIEFLNSTYDFDWIIFFNEMFYRSKEEVLNFCQAYQKVKPQKPWICAFRADAEIDPDTFVAMKKAGCVGTSAGIESGSDRVLKLMKKTTTVEQIKKFYRLAREAGLPCNGTFMVGNEGETEEDLKQTIDLVISEEMNTGESLMSVYPGTLNYNNALKRGLIKDEWSYFRSLRFGCNIWETDWINRSNYLNISEIPNERFWDVIVKEARRYYTFIFHRYQARNVEYKGIWWGSRMKAAGLCPKCGYQVVLFSQFKLVETENFCPNCFSKVVFNLYKSKDLASHFELLCKELKEAERLIILGTGSNAADMLRIDRFGLNYDRIMGFLEIKKRQVSCPSFINVPRLQIKDVSKIHPDIILVADDQVGDAELLLKMFYSKQGIQPPRILHLIPDKKRWSLRLTRLIGKFVVGESPSIMNYAILALGLQFVRTGFRLKIEIIRVSPLFRGLLRRIIGETNVIKLIRKIKHLY